MRETLLASWWRLAIVLGGTFAVLTLGARLVVDGGVTAGDVAVAGLSGSIYGALMGPWTAGARHREARRSTPTHDST